MPHPQMSRVAVTLVLWAGLAIAAGATGAFSQLKPPAPQLVILGLTLAAILAATRVPSVRSLVDTFSLRALISIHIVRFVGAVFLLLGARGALSPLFATRAGWGDIVAAAAAVALLAFGPPTTRGWRAATLAWNTFGVLDLVVAVTTATVIVFRGDVPGMEPLFRVPLILVPTFFVPLLLAGHVLIYGRLLSGRSANAD
ncbi:MAG TPA: hypothetical protein VFT29_19195 [Gemmatimonadaceae bacterium]|nr:hypothetical protein [Gemmatimonadaceae bacterium]